MFHSGLNSHKLAKMLRPCSANYAVAIQGEYYSVYGTSASSPVTAAILSAVNDARLAIDKKPIGFINPTVRASARTVGRSLHIHHISLDLLNHVPEGVQRHHERDKPRLRHGRVLCAAWLGPRHWRWHS